LLLYKLYLFHHPDDLDKEKYKRLVIKECPIYTVIINRGCNKLLNKLPIDLWRYTKEFLT